MDVLTIGILVGHIPILVLAYRAGAGHQSRIRWLMLALVLSALALGMFLLPENLLGVSRFFLSLALLVVLAAHGMLAIDDTITPGPRDQWARLWRIGGGIWAALIVASLILGQPVLIGQPAWLEQALVAPDITSMLVILALISMGAVLLGANFYSFFRAPMPEVANRVLFRAANAALLLTGIGMLISGVELLNTLGMLVLLIANGGAAYMLRAYRVLDIRHAGGLAARTLVLILITAVLLFASLLLANRIESQAGLHTSLILVTLALMIAAVFIPIRQVVEAAFQRLARHRTIDPTEVTRIYSLQVAEAVSLNALVDAATAALNTALRVQRSGLLLVSSTNAAGDSLELSTIPASGFVDMRGFKGNIPKHSPVYHALAAHHIPVLQFDLEYDPLYQAMGTDERRFFRELQMSVYAPIVVDKAFIGVLACGPKQNDLPYSEPDLKLVATLAQQTGVALRNARLIADLRHLNDRMKSLNRDIETAKEEIEKLDSVKTDFVTIASHELRTPLAQIRGYTDIIDALNEQGILDQDQIKGLATNLRKATERTEELIAAMLDVSQLDVDAMDLRLAQTTVENAMRLAIEPLADAIKQRRLTLTARGLRGLPPVHADMQRLVQAFRNVIVNAIKFTPDGGRIEINGLLEAGNSGRQADQILVTIQDTGVGIDRENLELVFQKFFRGYDPSLHSTGTYKFLGAGPGLGLTIAKGIIEGHGGHIWAESEGRDLQQCPGTTFYIALPVSPPEDAKRILPFEDTARSTQEAAAVVNPVSE